MKIIQQNAEIAREFLGRQMLLEIPEQNRAGKINQFTARITNVFFETVQSGDYPATNYTNLTLNVESYDFEKIFNVPHVNSECNKTITIRLEQNFSLNDELSQVWVSTTIREFRMNCILI